jgi:hypothetical protein
MEYLKPLVKVTISIIFLICCLITAVDASQSFYGRCLLEVDNKEYLNGPCPITMENDGSCSIGASEDQPITYFAVISVTGKDVGEGFWNEEKGANHAHAPLGKLVRTGACWQNQKAKVCAWK